MSKARSPGPFDNVNDLSVALVEAGWKCALHRWRWEEFGNLTGGQVLSCFEHQDPIDVGPFSSGIAFTVRLGPGIAIIKTWNNVAYRLDRHNMVFECIVDLLGGGTLESGRCPYDLPVGVKRKYCITFSSGAQITPRATFPYLWDPSEGMELARPFRRQRRRFKREQIVSALQDVADVKSGPNDLTRATCGDATLLTRLPESTRRFAVALDGARLAETRDHVRVLRHLMEQLQATVYCTGWNLRVDFDTDPYFAPGSEELGIETPSRFAPRDEEEDEP